MIRVVNVKGLRTPEERAGVCYVGRAFAGWPSTPWGNPFRPRPRQTDTRPVSSEELVADCLDRFRRHAAAQPAGWLESLWEACDHGAKPLGCWCTWAEVGDDQPVVCHAQILAAMLFDRFVTR